MKTKNLEQKNKNKKPKQGDLGKCDAHDCTCQCELGRDAAINERWRVQGQRVASHHINNADTAKRVVNTVGCSEQGSDDVEKRIYLR